MMGQIQRWLDQLSTSSEKPLLEKIDEQQYKDSFFNSHHHAFHSSYVQVSHLGSSQAVVSFGLIATALQFIPKLGFAYQSGFTFNQEAGFKFSGEYHIDTQVKATLSVTEPSGLVVTQSIETSGLELATHAETIETILTPVTITVDGTVLFVQEQGSAALGNGEVLVTSASDDLEQTNPEQGFVQEEGNEEPEQVIDEEEPPVEDPPDPKNDPIYGTPRNDILRGDEGHDQIYGLASHDRIYGEGGRDELQGGSGDDRLYGGKGNDVLNGGSGRDVLDGGDNNDTFHIKGNESEYDNLYGGQGKDTVENIGSGDVTFSNFRSDRSIEKFDGNDASIKGNNSNNSLDFRNTKLVDVDSISGEGGRDELQGGSGDDRLYGGKGNDVLNGGSGRDILDGGDNNDTFHVKGNESEYDNLYGGQGKDTVENIGSGDVTLSNFRSDRSIEKFDGNDASIKGNNSNNSLDFRNTKLMDVDSISGEGGHDVIYGHDKSNDMIKGGSGNDRIYGEGGRDELQGGSGDDRLYGGKGNDVLNGGSGRDILDGGDNNDTFHVKGNESEYDNLYGGQGKDTVENIGNGDVTLANFRSDRSIEKFDGNDASIKGNNSNNSLDFRNTKLMDVDSISGEGGHDMIYGHDKSNDMIKGGSGNDRVYGEGGRDELQGGSGDDRLYGGKGNDVLNGGSGRDILDGGDNNDTFHVKGNESEYDNLYGGQGKDTVENIGNGDVTLSNFRSDRSIEQFDGNDASIKGNNSNNSLDFRNTKLVDVDSISGEGGHDVIYGHDKSNDVIKGGSGNDRVYGEGGRDELQGGSGDDRLYGGKGNDVLNGGSGRDVLDGGDNNDTFHVKGNESEYDNLYGGQGKDTVENIGSGDVTLSNFRSDRSIEKFEGNDASIKGNNSNNSLDFRNTKLVDVDSISGEGGHDVIYGHDKSNDVIKGGSGNDRVYGEGGRDELQGGSGDDRLYGGKGNDVLNGGSGDDRHYGGEGKDIFFGSSGHDYHYGEAGNDVFYMEMFSGRAAVYGGEGKDWLDLGDFGQNDSTNLNDWLTLTQGHVESIKDNQLVLSDDARGEINTDDGSISFDDLESIQWDS